MYVKLLAGSGRTGPGWVRRWLSGAVTLAVLVGLSAVVVTVMTAIGRPSPVAAAAPPVPLRSVRLGVHTCHVGRTCVAADVTGDGRVDTVEFVKSTESTIEGMVFATVTSLRSTGSDSVGTLATASIWDCVGQQTCLMGDVNGDGAQDSVTFVRTATRPDETTGNVWVALSNKATDPAAFQFAPAQLWAPFMCQGQEVCALADVNGDHLDDAVAFVRSTQGGSGEGDVWVALSTGTSFAVPVKWADWDCVGNQVCLLADVNGDHKADSVTFTRDADRSDEVTGQAWVALSTGSSVNGLLVLPTGGQVMSPLAAAWFSPPAAR